VQKSGLDATHETVGAPCSGTFAFLASSSEHALRGTTAVNQYISEVGAKIETPQSQFLRGPMLLAGRQQADSKSRVPRMPMYDPLRVPATLVWLQSPPCRAMQSTACLVASLAPARRGVDYPAALHNLP
jgi:hypothetical protein